MKLYLVSTRAFKCYCVADSMDHASNLLTEYLKENDYGFLDDRIVTNVEFLGDSEKHGLKDLSLTPVSLKLFIQQ